MEASPLTLVKGSPAISWNEICDFPNPVHTEGGLSIIYSRPGLVHIKNVSNG